MAGVRRTISKPSRTIFKPEEIFVSYSFMDKDYGGPHYGADLVNRATTPYVVAMEDGVVEYVKNTVKGTVTSVSSPDALGNNIKIRHSERYMTRYCHLLFDSIQCKVGQTVKRGDVIATMGNTGYSFGAHVHFEVWDKLTRVDPEPFFNGTQNIFVSNPVPQSNLQYPTIKTTSTVKVRQNPSLAGVQIGQIASGGTVDMYANYRVYSDKYFWAPINYNGKLAYIADEFTNQPTTLDTKTLKTTDEIKFRDGASKNANVINTYLSTASKTIPANASVQLTKIPDITSDSIVWKRIVFKDIVGWVAGEYLK